MKITLNSHEYECTTDENGRTTCENFNGYIYDIIQELQKEYPLLFPEKPKPKIPLVIGIHRKLSCWARTNGIPQRDLGIALHDWCRGKRYKEALDMGRKYDMRFLVGSHGELMVYRFNERVYL